MEILGNLEALREFLCPRKKSDRFVQNFLLTLEYMLFSHHFSNINVTVKSIVPLKMQVCSQVENNVESDILKCSTLCNQLLVNKAVDACLVDSFRQFTGNTDQILTLVFCMLYSLYILFVQIVRLYARGWEAWFVEGLHGHLYDKVVTNMLYIT